MFIFGSFLAHFWHFFWTFLIILDPLLRPLPSFRVQTIRRV